MSFDSYPYCYPFPYPYLHTGALLERYVIDGDEPKYSSASCQVWFATDLAEKGHLVALKIVGKREYIEAEVNARHNGEQCLVASVSEWPLWYICLTPVPLYSKGGNGLDGQFVVDFLCTHVPEEEVLEDPDGVWKVATMRTKAGMQTCRRCEPFAEAPYILVMDRADMSLAQVLLSHRLIVHTQ